MSFYLDVPEGSCPSDVHLNVQEFEVQSNLNNALFIVSFRISAFLRKVILDILAPRKIKKIFRKSTSKLLSPYTSNFLIFFTYILLLFVYSLIFFLLFTLLLCPFTILLYTTLFNLCPIHRCFSNCFEVLNVGHWGGHSVDICWTWTGHSGHSGLAPPSSCTRISAFLDSEIFPRISGNRVLE